MQVEVAFPGCAVTAHDNGTWTVRVAGENWTIGREGDRWLAHGHSNPSIFVLRNLLIRDARKALLEQYEAADATLDICDTPPEFPGWELQRVSSKEHRLIRGDWNLKLEFYPSDAEDYSTLWRVTGERAYGDNSEDPHKALANWLTEYEKLLAFRIEDAEKKQEALPGWRAQLASIKEIT